MGWVVYNHCRHSRSARWKSRATNSHRVCVRSPAGLAGRLDLFWGRSRIRHVRALLCGRRMELGIGFCLYHGRSGPARTIQYGTGRRGKTTVPRASFNSCRNGTRLVLSIQSNMVLQLVSERPALATNNGRGDGTIGSSNGKPRPLLQSI